jgi:hypothetical protein
MFLCFSSLRRQISRRAELGTPYTWEGARKQQSQPTQPTPGLPLPQSYLIIVIQPHSLQSHNFMGLPVLGLEHCSIGA